MRPYYADGVTMKITAIITPENPLQLERLEIIIDRMVQTNGSSRIKLNRIERQGAVCLEFDGVNDEESAHLREQISANFGDIQIRTEVLWL